MGDRGAVRAEAGVDRGQEEAEVRKEKLSRAQEGSGWPQDSDLKDTAHERRLPGSTLRGQENHTVRLAAGALNSHPVLRVSPDLIRAASETHRL